MTPIQDMNNICP